MVATTMSAATGFFWPIICIASAHEAKQAASASNCGLSWHPELHLRFQGVGQSHC